MSVAVWLVFATLVAMACCVVLRRLHGLPVAAESNLLLSLSLAAAFLFVAIGSGMATIRSAFVRRLNPTPRVPAKVPKVLKRRDVHRPLSSARQARGWLAHRPVPTVSFFRRFLRSRRDESPRPISLWTT